MARNGSGTYSLPEPAFVPNTPISSAAVNSDFNDIANAITGSIAADGQTTITSALKLDNAGVVYASDPNTGLRRTAADTEALFAGGVDVAIATPTGVDFPLGLTNAGAQIVPSGSMIPFAGTATPNGWLLCYGQAVSRTTYATLFAAVGTTYGSGDGSTTFNIPDMRGRLSAGKDDMGGVTANRLTPAMSSNTLGASGGAANYTLGQGNLPSVSYNLNGTPATITVASNRGDIVVSPSGNNTFAPTAGSGTQYFFVNAPGFITQITSTGGYTPAGTVGPLGSAGAFNIVQPTLITNYIIKT